MLALLLFVFLVLKIVLIALIKIPVQLVYHHMCLIKPKILVKVNVMMDIIGIQQIKPVNHVYQTTAKLARTNPLALHAKQISFLNSMVNAEISALQNTVYLNKILKYVNLVFQIVTHVTLLHLALPVFQLTL
jgi:hypothetical protein